MTLTGYMLIGQTPVTGSREAIRAIDPATGQPLEPAYLGGTGEHVAQACALAWAAFDGYRETTLEQRAQFLETIATQIEALGDALIDRAVAESGLPKARIQGERGRTCTQLRTFARVVRAGEWLDVRVDNAQPERQPLPRADLRQRQVALGPVAVFGASNFPLAFSVAGGDTASALAAGCPVVVKAHSAHPGTSELVGQAVAQAVKLCGLPAGVFSLLYGSGREVGIALVSDPRIKAVGFTGSRSGGIALCQATQARPEPIPVYAEMSSINPVFLFEAALQARAEALAQGFVASLTQGAGQFCTNPGLVIAPKGRLYSGLSTLPASTCARPLRKPCSPRASSVPTRPVSVAWQETPMPRLRPAGRPGKAPTNARRNCSSPKPKPSSPTRRCKLKCLARRRWWWRVPAMNRYTKWPSTWKAS